MNITDLCYLSIDEAAKLISTRQLSPVELVTAHLDRISKTDGSLNSFITLLETESLAAARAADAEIRRGDFRGPMHGDPFGLKDLYYTKGVRTTVGSKIMRDFVPDYDAVVVEKLRNAGAIIMGKLQMHEFAFGATSENPHFGAAHNPWDTERITGGSSGGSGSAVAAGQVMAALGSDTGGSVRIPASLCGIVGLKPTFGRVSRTGVFPLSWSLDTVGPMTRTVRDAALVLNAIAGHDPGDPMSSDRPSEDFTAGLTGDVSGIRIGLPREFFFDGVDSEAHAAVTDAAGVLEAAGARVVEVSVPAAEQSIPIGRAIMGPESAEVHVETLRDHADDIDPKVRARLEEGADAKAVDYIKALHSKRDYTEQMEDATKDVDVLLSATTPAAATRIGAEEVVIDGKPWSPLLLFPDKTRPFNINGVPAVSLPCGFTSEGLPIGLQIAGRAFDEATVLNVAYAYEQTTDWHKRRPELATV